MKRNFEIDNSYSRNGEINLEVTGTLNIKDLQKIEKVISERKVEYISFDYEQTIQTWQEINRIIKISTPKLRISLYYYETPLEDLSFLEYLTNLEDLTIFYFSGKDISPIANLTKLTSLRFFDFQSAKVRLKPLIGLKNLTELSIKNIKDIEEIANFTRLKKISLQSLKIDNLNFMAALKNLEELKLDSSDRIKDYSGLYDLPKLKEAYIVKNYKDTSAEFVSHLQHLERLNIIDFNSVVKFPNLQNLDKLKCLGITNCKILSDISGVSKAQNLEEISLFVGNEFKPSALNVLKGHKNLKEISAGFRNKKENIEGELIIKELLKTKL